MAATASRVSNIKGKHSIRKRRESEEENIYLDLNRDPTDLLGEILYHVVKIDISKSKKLGYLNGLVRLYSNPELREDIGYSEKDIFCCMRVPLFHDACEVRAAALRGCRYLLHSIESTKAFCLMKVHHIVARSLDVLLDNRLERIHAIRLMRKFLCINPEEFPSAFTNCLIAVVNEGAQERELVRACLATLAQLSLLNPEKFAAGDGVSTMLRSVIDCPHPKITEAVLGSLLFLYNDPKTRNVINDLGFEHLLAPFTDSHYRYPSEIIESPISEEYDTKLSATKSAVVAVLRSWSGISYFSRTDHPELPSIIAVLYLPYPDIRKNIIELLFGAFDLNLPEWTDDFSVAIASADLSAIQNSWQLLEGYIVSEANYILPYISKDRMDLVENYFALLLLLFVRAGLLEALAEVIISGSIYLCVQSTILLGELLHMCNQLLPTECCHRCNTLPSLISAAAAFRSPVEQNQASAAVTCLFRIHEIKKQGRIPQSLELDNLLHICNPEKKRKSPFGGAVSKTKLYHYIKKDIFEMVNTALKDNFLFLKEYEDWDWDLIDSILKNPIDALKKVEDANHRNFIQKLLDFYKPCSKQFSEIEVEHERAQQIILTGYHFMEFLLEIDEMRSYEFLGEFLDDVNNCLAEVSISNIPLNAVFCPSKVLSTLSYSYFIFIGKLSCSNKGCKILDKCGTFQSLLQLISVTDISTYVKLVVSSLDYSKEGFPRTVLCKALTGTKELSRLYATNFLRVLLRAGLSDFRKWAIELLVTQLYDPNTLVSNAAIDILDEACNVQENLEALVLLKPQLLRLGDKGFLLMLRFLSIPSGFRYLQETNFLTSSLRNWKESFNLKYVKIIEDLLNQALTLHRKDEDGSYGRRSSDIRHSVHSVHLPHHMYGQLAQHNDGLDLLINEDCFQPLLSVIRVPDYSSDLQLLHLKAALWALGHIGSYPLGLPLLLKENVVPLVVNLAAVSPVLSVRGTCFFVLGLISSTPEGALVLNKLGWETVHRNHEEKGPILKSASSDIVKQSRAWSVSSDSSECPSGGLPYSLSFIIQTVEQSMSSSQSSQSLDTDVMKQSTSSSFSSAASVQISSHKYKNSARPRSSSDCQHDWNDGQFLKASTSSWDSLSCDPVAVSDHSDVSFRERSCSSYEIKNKFSFQSETDDSSSGISRNSCPTDAPALHNSYDDKYSKEMHASEHPRALVSHTPDSTSLCSFKSQYDSGQPSDISKLLLHDHSRFLRSSSVRNDTHSILASMKDAQGYATLKHIQRKRVQSLCFQDPNSYAIDEDLLNAKFYALGPVPAIPCTLHTPLHSISYSKSNNSLQSPTSNQVSEAVEKEDHSTNSSSSVRYIGLCLPSNFDLLFLVPKEPKCSSSVEVIGVEDEKMGLRLHTVNNCLASHSSDGKAGLLRITIDEEEETVAADGEMVLSANEHSVEPVPKQENVEQHHRNWKGALIRYEDTPEHKALIRKEVVRCVTNLSSSIAVKASEQGLLNLKEKFPDAFHDVCLYSEICLLLEKYTYRLPARRFLQELFLDSNFIQLQCEADSIMGITNLPQLSMKD